ncbi:1920_t:CDS:2, partial [Racocetra persica]
RNHASTEMDAFTGCVLVSIMDFIGISFSKDLLNLEEDSLTDVEKANSLWRKANRERKTSAPTSSPASSLASSPASSRASSPSPSMSVSSLGKRQRESDIIDAPAKKQYVPDINCFCPSVDVPLQANGFVNTLEVLKSAVRTFDQKTIALGSTRSYKCSNHLQVDSKCNESVPRESVYDAEMYRILHNWLAKVHRFEITTQWHLEGIGNDGDWHHFYCDLTIKKPDNPYPEVILELQATGSIPTLITHFNRAITYADQLHSQEIWIVHFSREDSVVSDPYWPFAKLQDRRLNITHFWHDKDFKNVRMSARFWDTTASLVFCGFSDDDDEGYYYDFNTGKTYTKSEHRYSIRAY